MPLSNTNLHFVIKILLAIILLSVLAIVAGSDLAPNTPLIMILIDCAIAAAVLLAIFALGVTVTLTFNQFILRNGGTDSDWFWFNGEPPGLEKQRAELKELMKNENVK